jgi:hypothetical protein
MRSLPLTASNISEGNPLANVAVVIDNLSADCSVTFWQFIRKYWHLYSNSNNLTDSCQDPLVISQRVLFTLWSSWLRVFDNL